MIRGIRRRRGSGMSTLNWFRGAIAVVLLSPGAGFAVEPAPADVPAKGAATIF